MVYSKKKKKAEPLNEAIKSKIPILQTTMILKLGQPKHKSTP